MNANGYEIHLTVWNGERTTFKRINSNDKQFVRYIRRKAEEGFYIRDIDCCADGRTYVVVMSRYRRAPRNFHENQFLTDRLLYHGRVYYCESRV